MKKLITLISIIPLFVEILFGQNMQINWQQCFGGSATDEAADIIEIPGGYLIIGHTNSNNGNISFNHGGYDAWIIRTDSNGNMIWEKTYGGSQGDGFRRIFPDNVGNYYLLGASESDDGDISNDPYPGSWDFWIVKIDSTGGIIWDKIIGGNGDETLWTGTATSDGCVVACGWSTSEDGDVSINYGINDIWMVKLSNEGEIMWDFSIGSNLLDYGQAIIQTSDGGFLVGGSSLITGGGNLNCESHGLADGVLIKLDSLRNIEWQQCYGGSDYDGITALIETSGGYIFGAYVNSNDGDISGWHGGLDFWIVKVDYDSNIIWQNPIGGSRNEAGNFIMQTLDNGIVAFCTTLSNDGDVSGNHSISEYDADIWVVKLNNEGVLLWQQCIGGIGDEELYFGVVKKSNNNFVIAGQTDYGPSFDVQCTPHGGLYDMDYWVFEIKDTTTSIQTKPSAGGVVKVYPNPVSEYVSFKYASQEFNNKARVEIFNSYGEKLENLVFYESVEQKIWDCRNTRPGIYFYIFTTNGYMKTGKIIIN